MNLTKVIPFEHFIYIHYQEICGSCLRNLLIKFLIPLGYTFNQSKALNTRKKILCHSEIFPHSDFLTLFLLSQVNPLYKVMLSFLSGDPGPHLAMTACLGRREAVRAGSELTVHTILLFHM